LNPPITPMSEDWAGSSSSLRIAAGLKDRLCKSVESAKSADETPAGSTAETYQFGNLRNLRIDLRVFCPGNLWKSVKSVDDTPRPVSGPPIESVEANP
jgi:hypothetical protein